MPFDLSVLNTLSWKQCMPVAIIIYDAMEGKVLYVNKLFAMLLGYEVSDLINKSVMDIDAHTANLVSWQLQSSALKHNGRVVTKSLYKNRYGELIPVEISSIYCNEAVERIICAVHDISQYTEQTEKISISLQEKEQLLKEIHHRVKNNLQTISSLLSLGRKKIQNEAVAGVLQESQNRIHAIATVHEILYKSDRAGRVDMSKYIHGLIESLIASFGELAFGVNIERKIEPIYLVMDVAMPCGLIINELVTNALQHAFTETKKNKKITISLQITAQGKIIMQVKDNGVGMNIEGYDQKISVGLKLVNMLVKQLDGKLRVDTMGGTSYSIDFMTPDLVGEIDHEE